MTTEKNYPHWNYPLRKLWLRMVRGRWSKFRSAYKNSEIRSGCVYYPDKVYNWLNQFDEMDKLMKDYYKNA